MMNRVWISLVFASALSLCFAAFAFGHGGGLDASGCHTNRKTGDYHCHRSYTPSYSSGSVSSGSNERAPSPTYVQVTTMPRARVYIDGRLIGTSPTPDVKISKNGLVVVRVEHSILGTSESTATINAGEKNRLELRW